MSRQALGGVYWDSQVVNVEVPQVAGEEESGASGEGCSQDRRTRVKCVGYSQVQSPTRVAQIKGEIEADKSNALCKGKGYHEQTHTFLLPKCWWQETNQESTCASRASLRHVCLGILAKAPQHCERQLMT